MTGQTFIDIVQQQARARPTALAYRCGDRRWTFADVERNPRLAADVFRFTPPKGADVISE